MVYESVNPATGERIKTFANPTDGELQAALVNQKLVPVAKA